MVLIDVGFSIAHIVIRFFTLAIFLEGILILHLYAFFLCLLADILILLSLSLGFQFAFALERVKLLLNFFGSAGLMGVKNHITATEALFNFDKSQGESWAELVKPNRYLGVFLFVLVVLGQGDFATWQVIDLTLGTVGSQTVSSGPVASLLADVPQNVVLDVLILG